MQPATSTASINDRDRQVIDLMTIVHPRNLDKASVRSLVADSLRRATRPSSPRSLGPLESLRQAHPGDLSVATCDVLEALAANDAGRTHETLAQLAQLVEQTPLDPLPRRRAGPTPANEPRPPADFALAGRRGLPQHSNSRQCKPLPTASPSEPSKPPAGRTTASGCSPCCANKDSSRSTESDRAGAARSGRTCSTWSSRRRSSNRRRRREAWPGCRTRSTAVQGPHPGRRAAN